MNITIKGIEHEITEDAPFIGARIIANQCSFRCKGCQNKHLKKEKGVLKDVEKIIYDVLENQFNEGVILGGLEWSEQPLEMLALVEEASQMGLKVAIYTGCELQEFHRRIGKALTELTDFEFSTHLGLFDINHIHSLVGATILDQRIGQPYYIKTGLYDKHKLVDDNIPFGIKLASSNQRMFRIEPNQEEDLENEM